MCLSRGHPPAFPAQDSWEQLCLSCLAGKVLSKTSALCESSWKKKIFSPLLHYASVSHIYSCAPVCHFLCLANNTCMQTIEQIMMCKWQSRLKIVFPLELYIQDGQAVMYRGIKHVHVCLRKVLTPVENPNPFILCLAKL